MSDPISNNCGSCSRRALLRPGDLQRPGTIRGASRSHSQRAGFRKRSQAGRGGIPASGLNIKLAQDRQWTMGVLVTVGSDPNSLFRPQVRRLVMDKTNVETYGTTGVLSHMSAQRRHSRSSQLRMSPDSVQIIPSSA